VEETGKLDPDVMPRPARAVTRRTLLKTQVAASTGYLAGNLLLGEAIAADPAVAASNVSIGPRFYPLTNFSPEIDLAGKIAVITGASSGNGRAAGEALSKRGVEVIGTSRDVASVPNPPKFTLLDLDISKPRSVSTFVNRVRRRLGASAKVDILINNAGRGIVGNPVPPAGAENFFFEQLRVARDTDYTGHLMLTTKMLPLLPTTGYARVYYTVSVVSYGVASDPSYWPMHAYFAMKRGMLASANALRCMLQQARSNIGVATVNPYLINTRFPDNLIFTEAISPGSPMDQYVAGVRQFMANGLPASFVGETYWQLLSTRQPPANVVVGSTTEPWASRGGNQAIAASLLAENDDAAMVFTGQ
jgi:NAD(P)-dependent dehydrogenase (short-subunit alcohol dehydrogenase family)